jgi:tight adherence protein B
MNDGIQIAASFSAFGVLFFFAGALAFWRRRQATNRLRRYVASHVQPRGSGGQDGRKRTEEASQLAVNLNRRLGSSSMAQRLQLQLTRSGLKMTASQFILGQVGLGAILFLIGRFILFESQGVFSLPLSLGMAIPAVVLPRFLLKMLQNRRVVKFENLLAQAVDVMAGGLQAGASLPQAFEMVGREMPDPIGEEFNRLVQEAAFAVPLDQALRNMVDRVPSLDLEMLVTAINIQYRVGGNLSHILKTIAHTIRERVRLRGVLSTLTAQARLSSYIIAGMPVVVVLALFVISPNYIIKLFDPGITRVMLIGGIMGIIAGFYIMKRIAAIEV